MTLRLTTDRYGRITVSVASGKTGKKAEKASPLDLYAVFHKHSNGKDTLHSGFFSTWTNKKSEPHGQGRATRTEIEKKGKSRDRWTAAKIQAIAAELENIPKSHPITIHTIDQDLLDIKYGSDSKFKRMFDEAVGNRTVFLEMVSEKDQGLKTAQGLLDKTVNARANNDNNGTRTRYSSTSRGAAPVPA